MMEEEAAQEMERPLWVLHVNNATTTRLVEQENEVPEGVIVNNREIAPGEAAVVGQIMIKHFLVS